MPIVINLPPLIIEKYPDVINLPEFLTYIATPDYCMLLVVDQLTDDILYGYNYETMIPNHQEIFQNLDYNSDLFTHELLCNAGVLIELGDQMLCIPVDGITRYIGRVVYPNPELPKAPRRRRKVKLIPKPM